MHPYRLFHSRNPLNHPLFALLIPANEAGDETDIIPHGGIMSFFDLLTLFGGLAMFLYGMRLMGDGLKESSSGTLKGPKYSFIW